MDNFTRSERTRNAALEAALTIIARDGPSRLTLDAIARESGISKGGLMHQFRTKEAVLKALVERQTEHFEAFFQQYMAEHGSGQSQPHLAARIATTRQALVRPNSNAYAVFGATVHEPRLLAVQQEIDAESVAAIKAEAPDPDLALLRWFAARGLTITALLGISPLAETERERLFERLLDDRQWAALAKAKPQRADRRAPKRKKTKL
jgi:AcrR family transcriptional regulator